MPDKFSSSASHTVGKSYDLWAVAEQLDQRIEKSLRPLAEQVTRRTLKLEAVGGSEFERDTFAELRDVLAENDLKPANLITFYSAVNPSQVPKGTYYMHDAEVASVMFVVRFDKSVLAPRQLTVKADSYVKANADGVIQTAKRYFETLRKPARSSDDGGIAPKPRIPVWLRWIGGVVTAIVVAVIAGFILHAAGAV